METNALKTSVRRNSFFGTGVCEKLFENGIYLPSGSNLTEEEFERFFAALTKIF